jgi:hypothetical protein
MNPMLENRVIVLSGVVVYQEGYSSTGIKASNPTTDKTLCPQVSVFCAHNGLEMGFFGIEEYVTYVQNTCSFIINSEPKHNTSQIHESRSKTKK